MAPKNSALGKNKPTVSKVVLDSGMAETMWVRGEITLTKRQIEQLATEPTIALTPEQAPESKPKKRERPVEWLNPLDAVHWLAPHVGGDASAKKAISDRLKDGAVECACVWICEGLDVGPLPTRRPPVGSDLSHPGMAFWLSPPTPRATEIGLGGAIFAYSDDWARDLERWDWPSGTIVTSKREGATVQSVDATGKPVTAVAPTRMVAFGVRLSREDIERINRSPETVGNSSLEAGKEERPKRGKSGPRPKKFFAGRIKARLEAEIANGELNKRYGSVSRYGVQSALEREIAESFGSDDCPSESTIRRWAKELMTAWRRFEGVPEPK